MKYNNRIGKKNYFFNLKFPESLEIDTMNDVEILKIYIMKLIDVTLRDGGHAVKFNWSLSLARNFIHFFRE